MLSVILGLLTNNAREYARISVDDLADTVERDLPYVTMAQAREFTAAVKVAVLKKASRQNEVKARYLMWAVALEVLAVILLAAAVGVILINEL